MSISRRHEVVRALTKGRWDRFMTQSAHKCVRLWALLNVVMLIAEQFVAVKENHRTLQTSHAIAILGLLALPAAKRWLPKLAPSYAALVLVLSSLPVAMIITPFATPDRFARSTASVSYYALQVMMLIFIAPVGLLGASAMAAAFFGGFLFAVSGAPELYWKSIAVLATALVGVVTLQTLLRRFIAKSMRQEVESELSLMPSAMLLASPADEVASSLEPRSMRCLVIASDWRGYQKLTAGIGADEVAAMLARYYEVCEELISSAAENVPIASDWIADELLVYFPIESDAAIPASARAALELSRELMRRKASLVFANGKTPSIDIGIALGDAKFGLFGPRGRRKVAAIGPALVEARRLQAQGKSLRALQGDLDRIVCDPVVEASASWSGAGSFSLAALATLPQYPPSAMHLVHVCRGLDAGPGPESRARRGAQGRG